MFQRRIIWLIILIVGPGIWLSSALTGAATEVKTEPDPAGKPVLQEIIPWSQKNVFELRMIFSSNYAPKVSPLQNPTRIIIELPIQIKATPPKPQQYPQSHVVSTFRTEPQPDQGGIRVELGLKQGAAAVVKQDTYHDLPKPGLVTVVISLEEKKKGR
ncbi:MAG: AMIN domain-containing protein [Deltaproteobacteria bacterium]|nr:AMIN domain-containing protein [Deltaproteobacteria bacterium]MBF0525065.1 AMIN domain-containing protein [Deltaproteobacteria bacterium]